MKPPFAVIASSDEPESVCWCAKSATNSASARSGATRGGGDDDGEARDDDEAGEGSDEAAEADEGLCHDSMVEVTRSRPPGFRPFAPTLPVPETKLRQKSTQF